MHCLLSQYKFSHRKNSCKQNLATDNVRCLGRSATTQNTDFSLLQLGRHSFIGYWKHLMKYLGILWGFILAKNHVKQSNVYGCFNALKPIDSYMRQ